MTDQIATDRALAAAALHRIRVDIDGAHTTGDLTEMYGRAVVAEGRGTFPFLAFRHLVAVVQMHAGLLTIIAKLDWLNARREKDLDVGSWMAFGTSDVVGFHVLLRSLFDEIAGFARELAVRPGNVADGGFRAMRDWLAKRPTNPLLLGETVAEVIASCEWFGDLRSVRDDIVHNAASTIVFPEPGRILFQVQRGPARRILMPCVMFNEHVADFTLYGALVMARLDDFLARLSAAVISSSTPLGKVGELEVTSRHPGLAVLATWLERLIASLEAEPQVRGPASG